MVVAGSPEGSSRDNWHDQASAHKLMSSEWTGRTVFRVVAATPVASPSLGREPIAASPNAQHWLKQSLTGCSQSSKWLSVTTVRQVEWMRVLKSLVTLVHGGRPDSFERLSTDKPRVIKGFNSEQTWIACYTAWNIAPNKEEHYTINMRFEIGRASCRERVCQYV